MPLASFEDALAFAGNGNKTVLLGNGFSMAYDSNSFKYYVFVKMLRDDETCAPLVNVFDALDTDDFEHVMGALNSSVMIAKIYGCGCDELSAIDADEAVLKDKLISFISDRHPENCGSISDERYRSTRLFLSRFSNFYTTNYDMLLYWSLLHSQCGGPRLTIDDGFRGQAPAELTWVKPNDQNVFYLHGAMHIYRVGGKIVKLRYAGELCLRDQVQARIRHDQFPLFVAGRNAAEKGAKIDEDRYLRHSLEQFSVIEGTLFVHGHSFDENDDHLFEAIKKNRSISRLCVSLFGGEDTADSVRIKEKARTLVSRDALRFYSAESANLWIETV